MESIIIKNYYVLVYNINAKKFETYDIFPYLIAEYIRSVNTPYTFEEFKEFIDSKAKYQWWSRCEYELILQNWPSQQVSHKIDVYDQVKMNLDTITKLFMEYVTNDFRLSTYKIIEWPEVQYLMDKPGFEEHSYLINDEKGLDDFGSSAYFVESEWLSKNY